MWQGPWNVAGASNQSMLIDWNSVTNRCNGRHLESIRFLYHSGRECKECLVLVFMSKPLLTSTSRSGSYVPAGQGERSKYKKTPNYQKKTKGKNKTVGGEGVFLTNLRSVSFYSNCFYFCFLCTPPVRGSKMDSGESEVSDCFTCTRHLNPPKRLKIPP